MLINHLIGIGLVIWGFQGVKKEFNHTDREKSINRKLIFNSVMLMILGVFTFFQETELKIIKLIKEYFQ